MGDALIDDLLDDLVPREREPLDWDGVLRAARASRRRRIVVTAAAACALAIAVTAPALAVLLRDYQPRLPKAADAAHAVVVLNPRTGLILEVAPWKGHDGICYLIAHRSAGCSMRSRRGGLFLMTPPAGFTFDPRVARVTVTLKGGRTVQLALHRFTGELQATFFIGTSGIARWFAFEDAAGHTIARMHLAPPRPPNGP